MIIMQPQWLLFLCHEIANLRKLDEFLSEVGYRCYLQVPTGVFIRGIILYII